MLSPRGVCCYGESTHVVTGVAPRTARLFVLQSILVIAVLTAAVSMGGFAFLAREARRTLSGAREERSEPIVERPVLDRVWQRLTMVSASGEVLLERILRVQNPGLHAARLVARVLPDRLYLAIGHRLYFGFWPNYREPRTLNERIHEYMLRCRAPILKVAASKEATRQYVEKHAGAQYLVPCYGVWTHAGDVPIESLPRPCVLKPTVGSGLVLFLHKGESIDLRRIRATLRSWLLRDYSRFHREWSYKGLPRGIIAEQMLVDATGSSPPDYKTYVIGGKVRFMQVDRGRFGHHTRNLYSPDWQLLPVRLTIENHSRDERPARLEEMIEIAERLAAPFEFLRVDYYLVEGKLYVGELTNYPGAGFEKFIPSYYAEEFGSKWIVRS
jgi:hypothetical protein